MPAQSSDSSMDLNAPEVVENLKEKIHAVIKIFRDDGRIGELTLRAVYERVRKPPYEVAAALFKEHKETIKEWCHVACNGPDEVSEQPQEAEAASGVQESV